LFVGCGLHQSAPFWANGLRGHTIAQGGLVAQYGSQVKRKYDCALL
jgi:hypothetical protein